MKRILLPLAMVTASVFVSLMVAEVLVRMVRPQPRLVITPGGLYTSDPPGRYRLSPGYRGQIYNRVEYSNEIRINGEGLRGPEIGLSAGDPARILVLGDSFVFGVGVEDTETFTALLPESLANADVASEALNAGIPAFGVPDAEGWLRRHGLDLQPNIVILAIFLGNDLTDAAREGGEVVIVDGLLAPRQSSTGVKVWLHRHSHLYLAIKSLLEQPGLRPLRAKLGLGEPWRVRTLREEFDVYRKSAEAEMQSAIETTDRAFQGLVSMARDQGFDLIAILIPSEVQIDPERWRAGLTGLDLDPQDYDPTVPTRIFKRLLARHEIPTLDLVPILSERIARGDELYFRFDRHWTIEGHALAAAELAELLKSRALDAQAD